MSVLAHQGGWDEFLLVLGPLLLVAWLLSVAKKRAERGAVPRPPAAPTETDQNDGG